MEDRLPLNELILECQECKSNITAQEVNDDVERYFSMTKNTFVRFPAAGVKKDFAQNIVNLRLICELCHEKEYG